MKQNEHDKYLKKKIDKKVNNRADRNANGQLKSSEMFSRWNLIFFNDASSLDKNCVIVHADTSKEQLNISHFPPS